MRRIALVMLLLSMAAVGVVGCAPSKADVAAQQKQLCFANERHIKTAIDLVHADSGLYPDIGTVVTKLQLKCPAGGAYSFDQNTDTVSCSVHGHQ